VTEMTPMRQPGTEDRMVLVQRIGAVAVLTLSQPQRRNALGRQMRDELSEQLDLQNADPTVRAFVITGAQGNFSAGGDIREMTPTDLLTARGRFDSVKRLVRQLAGGPKPLVAAIEGACIGAGLSIASLCDHVVISRSARLCAAFMRMGLLPDLGGYWGVQQRVGASKAREIFALARTFDGAEAHRIGLADEAVDPGAALARALEVATEYAAMPPMAQAFLRAAFAQGIDSMEAALRVEADYQPVLRGTHDHREAVAAFLDKRSPVFTGC